MKIEWDDKGEPKFAKVSGYYVGDPVVEAAHELYEALKQLLEDCDTDEDRISVQTARAVLAKIDGPK